MDALANRRGSRGGGHATGAVVAGHGAMTPRSLVLTWTVLGGAAAALFVFQWTHPGGGVVQRAAGPSPGVSSSSGRTPALVLPQPQASRSPAVPVVRALVPSLVATVIVVPSPRSSAASASPAASPIASSSPSPSTPTPQPPFAAAGATVVAPLPRTGHLTVKAALVIPAAPPWPSLDIELPRRLGVGQ